MRQTSTEKVDPLVRIQEEIKEVERREQEYRQLTTVTTISTTTTSKEWTHNSVNADNFSEGMDEHSDSLSMSPASATTGTAATTPLAMMDDNLSNTPSLEMHINSKETMEEQHSDDSGISASSSPINGTSTNGLSEAPVKGPIKEQRYIGPNCYNMTPEPPQQKLMPNIVPTKNAGSTKSRQFAMNPAHRGVMQRFIASRGKLQLSNNTANTSIVLNTRTATALLYGNSGSQNTPPNTPASAAINGATVLDFGVRNPAAILIPPATLTSSVIERDSEGRPIRPGYVPVQLKIQRELKDLKTRESELKKIRRTRQSTSDLLSSLSNEHIGTDDEDSEVEHCYGPGKLRATKSIGELYDATQSNNSISPRASPTPEYENNRNAGVGGIRPAMSLAQLCDLDPEEAPSSHRLIAQWENLIQQNA